MKKTLIASAVAAAALSTSAFAMDPASELAAKLDSMPTIYGNIQLATSWNNVEASTAGATGKESDYEMFDNGSTIGFKHSHEISPGVTGYLKAEFEFEADNSKGSNGLGNGDQAYIGVKGDFGDVRVGSYDTIYNDAIDDTVADLFEVYGAFNHVSTSEKDQIKYTSPSMSGFSVAASMQVNGESDGGKNGKARNPFQGAVMYSMGDSLELALAVDTADNTDKKSAYGLSATYTMGDAGFGLSFSTQDEQSDIISLSGRYTMGANQFMALFQMVDYEKEGVVTYDEVQVNALTNRDDAMGLTLQALHNVSDNMYVYVETLYIEDNAKDKANGGIDVEVLSASVGATYVF